MQLNKVVEGCLFCNSRKFFLAKQRYDKLERKYLIHKFLQFTSKHLPARVSIIL